MTAYPGQTWTNYAPPYGTPNHMSDVIQPGFELRTVVMPLAMRCSALDSCATRVR